MQKLTLNTHDLIADNIEQLKSLFPEAFVEGKVDFDMLRTLLGDAVEKDKERFGLSWPGKQDAIKMALVQNSGTLRPKKEESKDWDTTGNLFIEGDNLEVLRVLLETYRGKVKMIYIDPPYNTGNDFVYKDDFADNVASYKEKAGENMKSNAATAGRYHSNWLSMMYPRLKLAKEFLKDDGAIFVSIDDNECKNLRSMMDEIFGEENWAATFAWRKTDNQPNIGNVARVKEYIVCYSHSIKCLRLNKMRLTDRAKREYRYEDTNGIFRRTILLDKTRGRHYYDLKTPTGKILGGPWMIRLEEFLELEKDNQIYWTRGGEEQPYGKLHLSNSEGQITNDFLGIEYGTNQQGSLECEELFGSRVFDFPKPVSLIKHFATVATSDNDIILDFFAGSGTTAQATLELNIEDSANRKFILIQLPEITPEAGEARKAGFKTIADITKERIRRAGEKIKKENTEKPLDVGFKVFTLDTSNLAQWDEKTRDLQNSLLNYTQGIKTDRAPEDVLYEVLLKYGIDLTTPIATESINGKQVYNVGEGYLLVCLEKDVDLATIEAIAAKKPSRVVFLDKGFADDVVKLNAEQTLKKAGVEDLRVL